ncbi:hypothetical protein [Amycolatopsis cihanbeyliensis]|uniref:Uncharacterized protein n=1 Tax=Amycolatopsis cihanbeyliensis TaxID=1128664 RepID=A0A542DQF2_AMYCI|nr:hypothetical protein [Amycolatopsis cihanbeyliensis]TQJ05185.1 hypothetical protein FB471_5011 [Amycolatopsis cihanbeyliensis]
MSDGLDELAAQAEVLKLSRLLKAPPERFDFLERVPPEDLRLLRERATDLLFDSNLGALRRMAVASRLLPGAVLARIAERVFGPALCARVAGLVDVPRGVDVARRLSPGFLADVAAELDPRRASEIISGIPAPTVAEVAGELAGREDWITLGRFVGHLPAPAVSASLARIPDAALLRIAFVIDEKDRIDHVIGLLPPERFAGLARAAAEHDLWPSALDLLSHLGEAAGNRLTAAVDALEPDLRARAVAQARALGIPLRACS